MSRPRELPTVVRQTPWQCMWRWLLSPLPNESCPEGPNRPSDGPADSVPSDLPKLPEDE